MKKYDKNGDGTYSSEEVHDIFDDYMETIYINQNQKRIIVVSAILILILCISNVGTAFLAVTVAKEMHVSPDGTLISADGSRKTLKTLSTTVNMEVLVPGFAYHPPRLRNLSVEDNDSVIACLTEEEAELLYKNAQEGSGTILIVKDEEKTGVEVSYNVKGTAVREVFDSDESGLEDGVDAVTKFLYSFPESKLRFEYAPDKCSSHRRLFASHATRSLAMTNLP